ncbi:MULTISPECIES: hypothetical protein [unclassified Pseudonocardia]|uniref:hypothetical protein n=1 Tax=unclassified Pseudonocardia TaxID=2619320 RepID=UPI00095AB629|nr:MULTISPECIES: hypothetical protein [unclassified Pseudonocardia]MBN9101562.1 hypothetical protein [Pseudonocardia sp.]OJY44672.1 MAG: hypothetical protein BGP03_34200 [Pseudonocardia sp. 73-21]
MTIVAATAFTWLGLVLGISFLEAPLKFRAPGITVPLGLGIGRLVFRALNGVEIVLGVVVAVALVVGSPGAGVLWCAAAVAAALIVQLAAVRPVLTRRTEAVLAGEDPSRGPAHLLYVGLEILKVIGLFTLGLLAISP